MYELYSNNKVINSKSKMRTSIIRINYNNNNILDNNEDKKDNITINYIKK